MLDSVALAITAGSRPERMQPVLELLTQGDLRTLPPSLQLSSGGEATVTVIRRLSAAQGNGYVVDFRGQSMTLGLRGDYATGQQVRLASLDAGVRILPGTGRITTAASLVDIPTTIQGSISMSAAEVTLGADARMITALLARTTALAPGAPFVLAASPHDSPPTPPSPAQLKQAIDESGVFYESHLAEWAHGRRDINALQREPQAQVRAANQDSSTQPPPPDRNTCVASSRTKRAAASARFQTNHLARRYLAAPNNSDDHRGGARRAAPD